MTRRLFLLLLTLVISITAVIAAPVKPAAPQWQAYIRVKTLYLQGN
jgi:hypothetical protein